jgi:hypothetical protein
MALGLVAMLSVICSLACMGWMSPMMDSTTPAAAARNTAEGALFTGVFNDDPVAVHHAIETLGLSRTDRIMTLATVTAASQGRTAAMAELLRSGAEMNSKTLCGCTPLLIAAGTPGNQAMVRLLLAAGADPNTVGKNGDTPLSEAIRCGDADMTKLLSNPSKCRSAMGAIRE